MDAGFGNDNLEDAEGEAGAEQPVLLESLVAQNAELRSLIGDPLFKIMQFLDHRSINRLCAASAEFGEFCKKRESQIYRYLLARDFGVPADFYSNENTKIMYKAQTAKTHWAILKGGKVRFQRQSHIDDIALLRKSKGRLIPSHLLGLEPLSVNKTILIDDLWSMPVNICLKIAWIDSPANDAIYISDGVTAAFGVENNRIVAMPMITPETPLRVIERCYDRLYPEVLPFIFYHEIQKAFGQIVYPNGLHIFRNNPDNPDNPVPNPGPYRTLLDLFPGNYPDYLIDINKTMVRSLHALLQELTEQRPAGGMEIVDVGLVRQIPRTTAIESRFLHAYTDTRRETLAYLIYFNLVIRRLVF